MCILFMYNGCDDPESDYKFILATNRDESYDRPAKNMGYWSEDPKVIGGTVKIVCIQEGYSRKIIAILDPDSNFGFDKYKFNFLRDRNLQSLGLPLRSVAKYRGLDLGANCTSTWMALSPIRKKIGILLNLPGYIKEDSLSRGKIVYGYVTGDKQTKEYVEEIKTYDDNCNGFVFVTVEFGHTVPKVYAYNNVSKQLSSHTDDIHGFGNSLPDKPLKKVEAGTELMKDTCERFKKINQKQELIDELVKVLRLNKSYLPDEELESRRPTMYKQLSSIYVCVPEGRYGSRTHTLLLITKTGQVDVLELTMQMPIDPLNPVWEKTVFQFNI